MTISNATIERVMMAIDQSDYDGADLRTCAKAAITALLESGEVALTNNSDLWEHCNNIGKEKNWGAVCIEYMKPLHDQNGGDEPSGDASIRKDVGECTIPATSPTYTREELVEIALRGCNHSLTGNTVYRTDIKRALDALIAIGAVKVRT